MCSLNSGKLFEETGKGQYINTDSNPNAEPLQTQEPTESTNQEGSGYTFNVDNVYGGLPEVRRYDETHTPPNELGLKMNTNEELLNNISEQPQSVQLQSGGKQTNYFDFIIDPDTNKKYNIYSEAGKRLLKDYIKLLKSNKK